VKRRYFENTDWSLGVNEGFSEYWRALKKFDQVNVTDWERREQARNESEAASRRLAQEIPKLRNPNYANVWQEILKPLDGEVWPGGGEPGRGYAVNPESRSFFRTLVFLLLGTTFRELIAELDKDPRVYAKLLKVHTAHYRFLTGGGSFRDLKLKFQIDHFSIMVQGLDFGLETLNQWQLAKCFDEICSCGRHRHSVEGLKSFRTDVKKACKRLRESVSKPTSFAMPGH
jgi:hypothetical protein